MPSTSDSGTAMTAAMPARNRVFARRGAISETTVRFCPPPKAPALAKEAPKSPRTTPPIQSR